MNITYVGIEASQIQAEATVWKLSRLFPRKEMMPISRDGHSLIGVAIAEVGSEDYEKKCMYAKTKMKSFFGSKVFFFNEEFDKVI